MNKSTALTLLALSHSIDRIWFCQSVDAPENAGAARHLVSDVIEVHLLDVLNDDATGELWDNIITYAQDNAPESYFADLDIAQASTLQKQTITAEAFCHAVDPALPAEKFVDFSIRLAVALGADVQHSALTPAALLSFHSAGGTPLSAAIAALGDINEIRDPALQHGGEDATPLNPAQELTSYLEGWCLSFSCGDYKTLPWQLQKLDASLHFETDAEAWRFVTEKAQKGSALHRNALAFLATHAKKEYDSIVSETGYTG